MIKPELITDAKTSALSNGAWRLFVSMILLADDYGNLRAGTDYLKRSVFGALPKSTLQGIRILELFQELVSARLIEAYRVRDQEYAHISNWSKHQRIDRPHRPEVPERPDTGFEDSGVPPHIEDPQLTANSLPTDCQLTANSRSTAGQPPVNRRSTAGRLSNSDSTIMLSSDENCPSEMKGNEMKDPDPDPDHAGAWEQRDPAPARDPVPSPVVPPPEPEASRPPEPREPERKPEPKRDMELGPDGLPPLTWTPETPPPEYLAMLARLGQGGKP
jgi:hypothetical protein